MIRKKSLLKIVLKFENMLKMTCVNDEAVVELFFEFIIAIFKLSM